MNLYNKIDCVSMQLKSAMFGTNWPVQGNYKHTENVLAVDDAVHNLLNSFEHI